MKIFKGQLLIVKNKFTYKFFVPVFVEAEEAVVIGIHTEL